MSATAGRGDEDVTQNDEHLAKGDSRPRYVRLARHGTVIAKSSDFTRAAAILHTADVEVGLDGSHDQGGTHLETTAGVGFVSAQSRLDRIFQKDVDSKSSAKPPPRPPPPPPPPVSSSIAPRATVTPIPSVTPSKLVAISSVSSDGSNTPENGAHPTPPVVAAPPPLEGMFIRSPTRHRKLIKTKLSDLPPPLQEQEPQIRGGVAIYKVSDPSHRDRYGAMVEINAIDYITKLKDTIRDLERKMSLLQGKLEHEKRERIPANKQQGLRSSIRMTTFMGKRSKETEAKGSNEKASKAAPRGNTLANFGKPPVSSSVSTMGKKGSATNGPNKSQSSVLETKSPTLPKPAINFPNGFGFTPLSPPAGKTSNPPTRQSNPTKTSAATTEVKVNIPQAFGGQATTRNLSGASFGSHDYSGVRHNSDSASIPLTRQRKSQTSSEGEVQPARLLSDPPVSGSGVKLVPAVSKDLPRTFQPRKHAHGDRNAAPMPGTGSRRPRKGATVGRTRSFSGSLGDTFAKKTDDSDTGKASRAFSMHRESTATPPQRQAPQAPTNDVPIPKRSRGVRRLLGLR